MLNREVRFLVRWVTFLSLGALLQCCGTKVTRSETDAVEIRLQIPEGEEASLFWLGVQKKSLRVTSKNEEPLEFPWAPGSRSELDLRENDLVEFLGADDSERILVSGSARVTEEKKITIPLRRVL